MIFVILIFAPREPFTPPETLLCQSLQLGRVRWVGLEIDIEAELSTPELKLDRGLATLNLC